MAGVGNCPLPLNFRQKYNIWKCLSFEKFSSKIEITIIQLSVKNLQLSVRKLELSVANFLTPHDAASRCYK